MKVFEVMVLEMMQEMEVRMELRELWETEMLMILRIKLAVTLK